MTNPELRPATREDVVAAFKHLYGTDKEVPVRIFAYTGRVDGKVIAVGGIALYANGARIAFCDVSDEGRAYPLSLHRGAVMVLKAAKRLRIGTIVVLEGDDVHAKTPNWLAHLGFRRGTLIDGTKAFIWENR